MTNTTDSFNKMAIKSNNIGIKALEENFNIIDIFEEPSNFSPNDYVITLSNGRVIMVEIKVRNAEYDSYLMDYSKYLNLRLKEEKYLNKGKKIDDIWFVNCVNNKLFVFSLNKLRADSRKGLVGQYNSTISMGNVTKWFTTNSLPYLYTYMYAPKHTASDGNNNKMDKRVILFSIKHMQSFKELEDGKIE